MTALALWSPPAVSTVSALTTPTPDNWLAFLQGQVLPIVINLVGALAILLIGWLVAGIVASTARRLLRRARLDRMIGQGADNPASGFSLERWIATLIFWLILVLAVVAALNVLNLAIVSEPLNQFLNQIFAFLPKLGAAAVLAAVAWLVASLVRSAVRRSNRLLRFEERLIDTDTMPGIGFSVKPWPTFSTGWCGSSSCHSCWMCLISAANWPHSPTCSTTCWQRCPG